MSWIRSSKGAILGALLVLSLVAVGTAAAYTIEWSGPEEAQVGSTITVNATVQDPFEGEGVPDEWTIAGETELENASWSINTDIVGQGQGSQAFGDGDSISSVIRAENGTTAVTVEVTGQVPQPDGFNYASQANVTALEVQQVVESSIQQRDSRDVRQYTPESRSARQAIDAAVAAGARDASEEAENALTNAIEFYNGGNFDRAITNAEDAEELAEQQTRSGPSMLLIGGAVVLLLIVVGAVVYVYRSNQQSGHKLQ